jgi:4-hydroxybenzoate polyprenyltransferase
MMKLIKNQLVMSGLGIFIGLVLIIIAIIYALKDIETKNMDNFNMVATCVGVGAMLFTVSLIHFIVCLVRQKNPKFRRTQDIATKDERNIIISTKAASTANVTLCLFLIAAMITFTALGEKIYIIGTFSGLVAIDAILFWVYYRYYDKRL